MFLSDIIIGMTRDEVTALIWRFISEGSGELGGKSPLNQQG
jgi:hypothetical protein